MITNYPLAQRRMGRKLPYKLQSGRPFTHFFWLWSTRLYSCQTTWVTHFPKLSNSPNWSFLPILLWVVHYAWGYVTGFTFSRSFSKLATTGWSLVFNLFRRKDVNRYKVCWFKQCFIYVIYRLPLTSRSRQCPRVSLVREIDLIPNNCWNIFFPRTAAESAS